MQSRPYDTRDGRRVWLTRDERAALLDTVREHPRRELAYQFGLHGLRSDEVIRVKRQHVRQLDGGRERYKLFVPVEKRGDGRECPLSERVASTIRLHSNSAGKRQDEPLVDVTTKTLRDWITDSREQLADRTGVDDWQHVTMHDLRRTWATDTFYSLAFEGVPIAEELTMGWGGWKMNAKGRETFRENYLGPEPDHIAARAMDKIGVE